VSVAVFMQDTWLYHLIVASAGGHGTADTAGKSVSEYEQLVLNLMFVDANSTSSHWTDACLLHTKEPSLIRPLTTLHSDELQKKALDMFKACISCAETNHGYVNEAHLITKQV